MLTMRAQVQLQVDRSIELVKRSAYETYGRFVQRERDENASSFYNQPRLRSATVDWRMRSANDLTLYGHGQLVTVDPSTEMQSQVPAPVPVQVQAKPSSGTQRKFNGLRRMMSTSGGCCDSRYDRPAIATAATLNDAIAESNAYADISSNANINANAYANANANANESVNVAVKSRASSQLNNRNRGNASRRVYNRADSAFEIEPEIEVNASNLSQYLNSNSNSKDSRKPSRSNRHPIARRSESMRIAEGYDHSSPCVAEPYAVADASGEPWSNANWSRNQGHTSRTSRRTATLEVPDRLPIGPSGHVAYSTPPSPCVDRPPHWTRRTGHPDDFNDAGRSSSPYYHESNESLTSKTRSVGYPRASSCASSRDSSFREDEDSVPVRRLPTAVVSSRAQSRENLVRKHQSDAARYNLARQRYQRPEFSMGDNLESPPAEESERPERSDSSVEQQHVAPVAYQDMELRSNIRMRSSSTIGDGQKRTAIKRSETTRVSANVNHAAKSMLNHGVEGGSAQNVREMQHTPQPTLGGAPQKQRQRQIQRQRLKASSGLSQNVEPNALIKRNRAFSSVVNEVGSKSSRSDSRSQSPSLSAARVKTGSCQTLADVNSLQYIDLYRALRSREQLLEEIRESFKLFDKDGDGTVSKDEIAVVMRQFGQNPTDEEIDKMVSEVDEDGNGCLDFNEFSKMMLTRFGEIEQQDKTLQRVFRVFDKDGDGFIDAKELKRVMNSIGEPLTDEEITEMIRTADTDGDGKVSYEEFAKLLSSVGVNTKAK